MSNKVRIIDRKLDQLYKYIDQEGIENFAIAIDQYEPLDTHSAAEMQRSQHIVNYDSYSYLIDIEQQWDS